MGANLHKSEFLYDGLSRKRISREYEWINGTWELQSEVRRICGGMNVVQERDGTNAVTATYTRGQDMGGGIGGLLARSVYNLPQKLDRPLRWNRCGKINPKKRRLPCRHSATTTRRISKHGSL